jgi:hypothetical protein
MSTVGWSDLRYLLAFQRAGSLAAAARPRAVRRPQGQSAAPGHWPCAAPIERMAGEAQRPEGVVRFFTTDDRAAPREAEQPLLAGEEAACSVGACPPDA